MEENEYLRETFNLTNEGLFLLAFDGKERWWGLHNKWLKSHDCSDKHWINLERLPDYERHRESQKDRELLASNYWWLHKCQTLDQRFHILSIIQIVSFWTSLTFRFITDASLGSFWSPTMQLFSHCQDTMNPASQPLQWPTCIHRNTEG